MHRRLRANNLGSAGGAGAAVFDRNAVLKEAVDLGVCLEDRAQLEALARFAFASPGFRAETTVRIGDDRATEARFEISHTPEGPTARRLPAGRPDPASGPSVVPSDRPSAGPSDASEAAGQAWTTGASSARGPRGGRRPRTRPAPRPRATSRSTG